MKTTVEYSFAATAYSAPFDEIDILQINLIKAAQEAAKGAYAPYSGFSVGAAVLLENGEVISGNNQENAAYPSGLCAERVALFYANSKFPDAVVTAIAITAYSMADFIDTPLPPCGACRQVIAETQMRFDSPIKLILAGKKKVLIVDDAMSLLPIAFEKTFLHNE